METIKADVIICGAGPAGAACAIRLAGSGLEVALLDKAIFPRDKTCGDALSIDVINQLELLSPELAKEFSELSAKTSSYGVRIFSPSHEHIDIPFIQNDKIACGYISPRMDFDNLLLMHAKKYSNIHIHENCSVEKLSRTREVVIAHCGDKEFIASLIIGADGAHSMIAKVFGNFKVELDHYTAGLRVYYEGITGLQIDNYIEIHFLKDVLPGYLWIFPLPGNKANVGIGVPSSLIAKKKINLRETLQRLLVSNEHLKERFKDATALETAKGYGLPLGSKKRKISGERFLLAGDAASMIDPLSGEGIGNAIRCGRVAAEHAMECFKYQDFSASFNKAYDKEVYRRMWKELRISRIMQKIFTHGWILTLLVKNGNKSKYLKKLLTDALGNSSKKKHLIRRPSFYWELFKGG